MRIFGKKNKPLEVLYYGTLDKPQEGCSPMNNYERFDLWRDVVRVGLGQLVAVDEVLSAARKVLDEYDTLFGPPATEPEVAESFYELGPDPFAGDEDATVQDVGR